jgi:hypothetical protein
VVAGNLVLVPSLVQVGEQRGQGLLCGVGVRVVRHCCRVGCCCVNLLQADLSTSHRGGLGVPAVGDGCPQLARGAHRLGALRG